MNLQSERARFEEWITKNKNDSVRTDIHLDEIYDQYHVQYAWESWCAALGIKEEE